MRINDRGRSLRLVRGVALLALAASATVNAQSIVIVNFDLSPFFNADVICNNGAGLDTVQDSIDYNALVFPTQSVAVSFEPGSPDGLPDNGLFIVPPEGLQFQLDYDNSDNGDNARSIFDATDQFTFSVPVGFYQAVHLFGTCGNGDADVTVRLNYGDLTNAATNIVIRDWYDDDVAGWPDEYFLINDRDRMRSDATEYFDENSPAIFGFRIQADPTRSLVSVTVTRNDSEGVMNIFGASGEQLAPRVPVAGLPALLVLLAVLAAVAVWRLRA